MNYLSRTHIEFKQQGWLIAIASWLCVCIPLVVLAGRAPSDIAASLVAVLFLAHSAIKRDFSWLNHGWVRAALLLWLYMLVASCFADDAAKAVGRAAVWLRYPMFGAALAYSVLQQTRARELLLRTGIITLLFLLADGFLQYATGTDIVGRSLIQHEEIFRLTGPFSAPRLGITLVWLCLPIACYALGRGKGGNRAMLAGIGLAAAMAVLVYVSGERMATLFMAYSVIGLLLLCNPLRLRVVLATLLALAGIGLLNQHDPQLATRQLEQTHHEIRGFFDSAYGRAWESAIMVWESSPVIGVGAKHFEARCNTLAASTHYADGEDMFCPMHPHNVWLEWLVYYGIIGTLLFCVLIGCWLRMAWQHRQAIMGNALLCGLFITLTIRFFPIASTASQFTAWSAVPLWLCVGWLIALLMHTETTHADRHFTC